MHPWIAALVVKERDESPTVESKCSATLVNCTQTISITKTLVKLIKRQLSSRPLSELHRIDIIISGVGRWMEIGKAQSKNTLNGLTISMLRLEQIGW